ncbi:PAC2 family protein [Micromonospora olivasterospora]|uniref:PAC2 family protein n=1 Tax=Micromonospora olivasterospora TaxID=1880 RepID=A0A562IEJ6_MICOL|nr:PAC2 family protein [Micromonospora olivasterospora]
MAAVAGLAARLDVRLTVGLNSIPMAVPHTRPTGVTAHATRRDLIAGYEPWLQRVQVPGSVGHLLEYRLGEQGRDALGFAAHVPHYVAQTEYPAAAEVLLASVSRSTGLLLPRDGLRSAAEVVRVEIDRQVAQTDEAAVLVQALEEQYDAFARGRGEKNLLAAETGPLPTADELGAELERFLAEQGRPGDTPGS